MKLINKFQLDKNIEVPDQAPVNNNNEYNIT